MGERALIGLWQYTAWAIQCCQTRQGEHTVESLLGTTFTVTIVEAVDFHGLPAVVPEVSGRAWITGFHEFLLDPEDPLPQGFLLR